MTNWIGNINGTLIAKLIMWMVACAVPLGGGCTSSSVSNNYPEARSPEVQAVVEIAKANGWDEFHLLRFANVEAQLLSIYAMETNTPRADKDWWFHGGRNKFAIACLILQQSKRPDRETIARRLLEEGRDRGDGLCILSLGCWDAIGSQAAISPHRISPKGVKDMATLATAIEQAVQAPTPAFPENILDFYPIMAEQGATTPETAWEILCLIGNIGEMPGVQFSPMFDRLYASRQGGEDGQNAMGASFIKQLQWYQYRAIHNGNREHTERYHIRNNHMWYAYDERLAVAKWLRAKCRTGWLSIPAQPFLADNPPGVQPPGGNWNQARYSYNERPTTTWEMMELAWGQEIRQDLATVADIRRSAAESKAFFDAKDRDYREQRESREAADREEQRQQWAQFGQQYGQGGGIQGELSRQNTQLLGGSASSVRTPSRDPEPGVDKTVIYDKGREPRVGVHQKPPANSEVDLSAGGGGLKPQPSTPGQKNGWDRTYFDDGRVQSETYYVNGKKNGEYRRYFITDINEFRTPIRGYYFVIESGQYENDQRTGEWKTWRGNMYNDKPVPEQSDWYSRGRKTGKSTRWDTDDFCGGRVFVVKEEDYWEGVLSGEVREYEHDCKLKMNRIKRSTMYSGGKKNGPQIEYRNGVPHKTTNFVDGEKVGP